MRHIHVLWSHDDPDDPIELFSELDDEDREVRKVEVFRGGMLGFAGATESSGSTSLGLEPIPSLGEIALDAWFRPEAIAQSGFERAWDQARASVVARRGWEDSRLDPRKA